MTELRYECITHSFLMPDHRNFQLLYRQIHEIRSFHVTSHGSGRQRAVRSPRLEESILNVVIDRPESSTRTIAHLVNVSHQTVCRELNENSLHLSFIFNEYKL
ncbi:hypothetical protein TNCV_578391 [Trichonephila clavipes]|nr:hypothetical protein TNCV_578391 [Trichonephila clavipes]